MDYRDETLYTLALTRLPQVGLAIGNQLIDEAGSATMLYAHRHNIGEVITHATPRLQNAIARFDDYLPDAERELDYMARHNLVAYTKTHPAYPHRLLACHDAPLLLFFYGNTGLNPRHTISIVGSRKATPYGRDFCQQLIADIARQLPQTLIVSGLAYGIDICAHRHALLNGFETVGVLAHGLDELYPTAHRKTAEEMLAQGGLLTEYMFQTRVDKSNFVRRNRIVAGMSDAVVLVESADKGGGLITARIGRDYNREVFAFPGAVGAKFSEGCNLLIRNHEAALIRHAADLVEAMDWPTEKARSKAHEQGVERQLFPDLTDEERKVADALQRQNDQQVNTLSVQADIPVGRLSAILFSLEMKGVVKAMAGGTVHLMA